MNRRTLVSVLRAVFAGMGLALALAGCAELGLAPPPPLASHAPEPSEPVPASSGPQSDPTDASQALLSQSRLDRAAGRYPEATASVERALRIDPNNPALWLELGEIQLAAGNDAQAATMARKALTLAAGDVAIRSQAQALLEEAAR
jgi:tetratricopeptide (TPR) repeat protein